jgi:hypothetical protein
MKKLRRRRRASMKEQRRANDKRGWVSLLGVKMKDRGCVTRSQWTQRGLRSETEWGRIATEMWMTRGWVE